MVIVYPKTITFAKTIGEMKKATTIEEQIKKLKDRNVIIGNEDKARENLLDIGYFRLGFYCFPFEVTYPEKNNRNHKHVGGTLFEDIIKLYYFDVDMRNLLSKYIYRIEINFRTYLIYTVSNRYPNSSTWFVDNSVVKSQYTTRFDDFVYNDKFRDIQVIKCHHQHHINDRYAPAWKTIEYMTFGAVIRLYKNLKDDSLKREIARYYNYCSTTSFENNLETILLIRNSCAHSNVLFDINMPKSIKDGPAGKMSENKHNLAGAIKVIEYMLKRVSCNRFDDMIKQLNEILSSDEKSEKIKNIIQNCSGLNF